MMHGQKNIEVSLDIKIALSSLQCTACPRT